MANNLKNNPIIIDTDITSFRTSTGYPYGIKPAKIVLAVGPGGASTAGTVQITRPADGVLIYPPLVVAGASAANVELYVDDPSIAAPLNWNDFAVTGVTATGTRLFIWYNI